MFGHRRRGQAHVDGPNQLGSLGRRTRTRRGGEDFPLRIAAVVRAVPPIGHRRGSCRSRHHRTESNVHQRLEPDLGGRVRSSHGHTVPTSDAAGDHTA